MSTMSKSKRRTRNSVDGSGGYDDDDDDGSFCSITGSSERIYASAGGRQQTRFVTNIRSPARDRRPLQRRARQVRVHELVHNARTFGQRRIDIESVAGGRMVCDRLASGIGCTTGRRGAQSESTVA